MHLRSKIQVYEQSSHAEHVIWWLWASSHGVLTVLILLIPCYFVF